MKVFGALLAALGLAGCMTTAPYREEPATPRLIASIAGASSATVILRDGRKERIGSVREFGDALCGYSVCVRKADIVTIGHSPQNLDIGSTLLAVPFVPVVAVGAALVCATGCDYGAAMAGGRNAEGPVATPEQLSRRWLDTLAISNGRIIYDGDVNHCVAPQPSAPARTFATDDEAFAWIIEHRTEVTMECLTSVKNELGERDRQSRARTHRDARMRIDVLMAVRARWNYARCKRAPGETSRLSHGWNRIAPNPEFDLERGKGDVALLAIIEETLADPASYTHDRDLETTCNGAVLPPERWPGRSAFAQATSPFAPMPQE